MIPTGKISRLQTLKHSGKSRILLADIGDTGKKIIIKELSGDLFPVYSRLRTIRSRHFPKIYKLKISGGTLHVAEEYIEGKLLAQLLSERAFPPTEAVGLIIQLCDGVSCLHRAIPPIIHRDLTPWNILITEEHVLKIIDFDAARSYRQRAACDTRRLGTAEYAPPEQFGYSQTDERSDIYSIGVLLYELVYCRAFQKTGKSGFCRSWRYRRINKIITRCTMFSPDQRYQSVRELRRALIWALPFKLRFSFKVETISCK